MTAILVDTNILAGLLDPDDALHEASAAAIQELDQGPARFLLSAISWSEALTGVLRHDPGKEELLTSMRDIAFHKVIPVDGEIASLAARLRAEHPALRTPDALIIASARRHQADVLLTADSGMKRAAPELVQLVSATG